MNSQPIVEATCQKSFSKSFRSFGTEQNQNLSTYFCFRRSLNTNQTDKGFAPSHNIDTGRYCLMHEYCNFDENVQLSDRRGISVCHIDLSHKFHEFLRQMKTRTGIVNQRGER